MKTNTTLTTTPALTLNEAVLAQVENLIPDGSFSAHDVTSAVRAAANAGTITLPGLEARPNDEGIKYWVNHEDVKRVIAGLVADGTMANLGMTNVDNSGTYRLYVFGTDATPAAATPAATPTVAGRWDQTTNANPTRSPVESKIETYLNKVGTATLKQIQSALKINGITCKDLATMVAGLGFTVTPGTDGCFSTYTAE